MTEFIHPKTTNEVPLEGTYVIRDDIKNQYVFLSEASWYSERKLYNHKAIANLLSDYGLTMDDLDFSVISNTYSSTFLDA